MIDSNPDGLPPQILVFSCRDGGVLHRLERAWMGACSRSYDDEVRGCGKPKLRVAGISSAGAGSLAMDELERLMELRSR